MPDLTHLIEAAQKGDRQAADQLLPLVYDELRKLAAAKMAAEKPGHTLNATALVHEAYLRLVASPGRESGEVSFDGRGHFFAAAAEAMRRILVERARAKHRLKRGSDTRRQDFDEGMAIADDRVAEVLAVHDALDELERHDAQAAALVKLRFFAGFGHQEAAEMLGLSRRAADGLWLLARTWLYRTLNDCEP
jgi:RNA polymerase sigma factor (TIGR02999 family)